MRMQRQTRLWPLLAGLSAAVLAGCGTPGTPSVDGLRAIVGTELPGAQGLREVDQDRIDETVARLCAPGVRAYTREECKRHDAASAERLGL